MRQRAAATVLLSVVVLLLLPARPASAHPLGNFTVNAAAVVTVSPGQVRIDYALDLAEIPTFQERRAIDSDGDGSAEDAERAAWADRRVAGILAGLSVAVDGEPVPLRLADASMTLRPGQGGLDVLRLEASLFGMVPSAGAIVVEDGNDRGRLGWREITATGADGVAVTASSVPSDSPSDALRSYPVELLSSPPSVRRATFSFGPGRQAATSPARGGGSTGPPAGAEGPLAGFVARSDLSPALVLLALVAAVGVGALHALAPGHGKTVAAAYLAGTGSRIRQALSVGVTVAAMHTASVLVLGAALLFGQRAFPAERLYPWMGIAAGIAAVALGAGLLIAGVRRRRVHGAGHDHSHSPLSRRGLAALALSGGLLPSPTAVVVLLAAASLGRLALGLGMVAAFGIGLAASLTAVGALAVGARDALGRRVPARVTAAMPVAGAGVIVAMGAALAVRAVTQL